MTAHRVLSLSHGHPDFSRGGAETAAHALAAAYRAHPGVERSVFVARNDRGRGATGAVTPLREDEYLIEQAVSDWFRLESANPDALLDGLTEVVRAVRPTIIHVHHFVHLGLEMFRVLRLAAPEAQILLTLHEFVAICENHGQMIKTGGGELCRASGLEACSRCFPARTPEDFWLRRHRFQTFFRDVDLFVAPSAFLRDRYVEWGLVPERVVVLENGQPPMTPLPPRALAAGEGRGRFGYFGQITPFKGLEVVLRGLAGLSPAERAGMTLEINAANLDQQPEALRARIEGLVDALSVDGTVQWRGPYAPSQMGERLSTVDWLVIPSTWWENSPMVIQEAFGRGRPVLCSDIGGMAEKVRDGIDGRHVAVGSEVAWGAALRHAADPGQVEAWDMLRRGIEAPPTAEETAARILDRIG